MEPTRARLQAPKLLTVAGACVLLIVALAAFGWWSLLTRGPQSLTSFTRPSSADCFVLTRDQAIVQFEIRTADNLSGVDAVNLIDAEGLSVLGVQVVSEPFDVHNLPTANEIEALASRDSGFYHVPAPLESGLYLAVLVQRSTASPRAFASGVAIVSVHGEPLYVDELPLAIRVTASGCTATVPN